MTIKDVETRTGLTAKSIRYYEQKNLLSVKRNQENDYRIYTEENVTTLKWIKIFRYLDFTVEEIDQLLHEAPEKARDLFAQKADGMEKELANRRTRQELCLALSRDYTGEPSILAEYEDTVQLIESDELADFRDALEEFSTPSFSHTLIMSLVFLGPILSLFINIAGGQWDALLLNSILAIGATVLLTLQWFHYLSEYHSNKKRVQEKNRKTALAIPLTILTIVLALIVIILLFCGTEWLLAPDGWLFYEHDLWAQPLIIFLVVFPVFAILIGIGKMLHLRTEFFEKNFWLFDLFSRYKILTTAIWLFLFYLCSTNVTFVTDDAIICHSPLHPTGIHYAYGDVVQVEARFGEQTFAFLEHERKGNFSYTLHLQDGNRIVFSVPSVNETIERYVEHTYLELEEFDQTLMTLGIPKISNENNADACTLDTEYVDRFLRIIRNQP